MGRPRMSDSERAIKTAERKHYTDRGLPPFIDGYIDGDYEAYRSQRASEVKAARKLAGQRAGAIAAILRMRGIAAK